MMLSCKEATRLTIIKEEKKISFKDSIKLSVHFLLCKYCKYFSQQSRLINKMAGKNTDFTAPGDLEQSIEERINAIEH